MKQQIVIVCGPDMCGKTQIAKELARQLEIPYFKASSEHDTYLSRKTLFINQLRYADTRVVDLLTQTGHSIIFDRAYPCEWVYSAVMGRDTDLKVLMKVDTAFATLGAKIVICHRSSYKGILDDIDANINENKLIELADAYREFAELTKCEIMFLNVDDEDLTREVNEITEWLNK